MQRDVLRLLTKRDLIEEVARVLETSRREARLVVQVTFDSIAGALKRDEKVELRGFGSFHTRRRRSRTGRNPKSGTPVEVPPKRPRWSRSTPS